MIYVLIAFAPLALAARAWPVTRGAFRRLCELGMALGMALIDGLQTAYGSQSTMVGIHFRRLTCSVTAPPAGFEPAAHGLGNRCSIP